MVAPVHQLISFGECVGIAAHSASPSDFQGIGEVITVSLLRCLPTFAGVLELYDIVQVSTWGNPPEDTTT